MDSLLPSSTLTTWEITPEVLASKYSEYEWHPDRLPAREGWRELDKSGEEFRKYFIERTKEATRFNLDRFYVRRGNYVRLYWEAMSPEKQEELLDYAVEGIHINPNTDLDDYRAMPGHPVARAVFRIQELVRNTPNAGTDNKKPKKQSNSLLKQAVLSRK